MSDTQELAKLGLALEWKRKRLRTLLRHRDAVSYAHVHVRLDMCYMHTQGLWMAAKKAVGKSTTKAEFIGFFNFELDADMKASCKDWLQIDEEIGVEIEQAIASGYKIGLSKDGRTDGYQATMQQMIAGEKNAGYCMSAFAKHWYTALGVLMFKHAKVLHYDWSAKPPVHDIEDFG